jgi:hypothetical protein
MSREMFERTAAPKYPPNQSVRRISSNHDPLDLVEAHVVVAPIIWSASMNGSPWLRPFPASRHF